MNSQFSRIMLIGACLLALPAAARAVTHPVTEFAPRTYQCVKAFKAPQIDGLGDDPAWQNAAWSEDFSDISGGDSPAPALRTRTKLLWDAQNLYVLAELEEPAIQAELTEHDSVIFQDNDFELFIDPDSDNQLYGELEINALGTVWDLLLPRAYRDGGHAVNGWDIQGLQAAIGLDGTVNDASDTDNAWMVELAIPWTALSEIADCEVPPHPGDRWRLNFSRVEYASSLAEGRHVRDTAEDGSELPPMNWVWSPQGVVSMHCPEVWGIVEFAGGIVVPGQPKLTSEDYARQALMCMYYWQHDFHEKQGRYSGEKIEHWYDDYPLPEVDLFREWLTQDEILATQDHFRFSLSNGMRSLSIDESGRISASDGPLDAEALPAAPPDEPVVEETPVEEPAPAVEEEAAPAETENTEDPHETPKRTNPGGRDTPPE